MAESIAGRRVGGMWFLGRDRAGCVGKGSWILAVVPMQHSKKYYPEEAKARFRDKSPNWILTQGERDRKDSSEPDILEKPGWHT